jgi:hypothetical protein
MCRWCGRLCQNSAPAEERQHQSHGCEDDLLHVGILRPKAGAGNTIFFLCMSRRFGAHQKHYGDYDCMRTGAAWQWRDTNASIAIASILVNWIPAR